jgi:hypothetical protein
MKLSWILAVLCTATCGLFTLLLAPGAATATFLGMAAPLAGGLVTILMVEHVTRTDIRLLTHWMTIAFVAKMVFYGLYVSLAMVAVGVDVVPFSISFTLYFAALHVTEALYFKTLFAHSTKAVVS